MESKESSSGVLVRKETKAGSYTWGSKWETKKNEKKITSENKTIVCFWLGLRFDWEFGAKNVKLNLLGIRKLGKHFVPFDCFGWF